MKITVVGTGYVGLTTGAMFAELGHCVTCIDKDNDKIKVLKTGKVPFHEPGLDKLLQKHLGRNLKFTTGFSSIGGAKAIVIAVGTPPAKDGSPDLSYVLEVAGQLIPYLKKYKVIIMKSTVPVGAAEILQKYLLYKGVEAKKFDIVSNPEFLREGTAVFDSFHPDRIIIGSDSPKAIEITRSLYQRIECPVMVTSNKAAEMIKYAANAFLATKISFINELAGICEEYEVDISEVARGIGYDARIGHQFLRAGAGYGGSCLPKDLLGLMSLAFQAGKRTPILKAVNDVNARQTAVMVEKLESLLGSPAGKKIAVWGLAFKPETDDMRFAPAVNVIKLLLKKQAHVSAFDPVAAETARKILPHGVKICEEMYEAARECEALIVMTEWDVFVQADLNFLKQIMKKPIVIDGRNIYSPSEMKSRGFLYKGVGR